eukprot:Seg815.3 transcript_id=Seg815.3/GoldUCD/mRNA.D3Y31 product="hypothetical protein" protein_id=Seg815.3/GoldUCD/D3Y31
MSGAGRYMAANAALQQASKPPATTMKETWIGDAVQRRENRDNKWYEHRRTKAMSWPKSMIAVEPGTDDMHHPINEQDSEKRDINSNVAYAWERPLGRKHVNFGRSMGRLLEETECNAFNQIETTTFDTQMKDTIDRTNGEESSMHSQGQNESENPILSSGYRRSKGGLRNLIKLHEEEIARASGAQGFAKRPKREEWQTSRSGSFDENQACIGEEGVHNITAAIPQSFVDKQLNSTSSRPSSMYVIEGPNIAAEADEISILSETKELKKAKSLEANKDDKSTFTGDDEEQVELETIYNEKFREKDLLIEALTLEKEELLSKFEEQKKVANAYQKLEDRYRRKVFDLEKMMFSCTCGVVDSRNASNHDIASTFVSTLLPSSQGFHQIVGETRYGLSEETCVSPLQ